MALAASQRIVPCNPIFDEQFALGVLIDEPYIQKLDGRRARCIQNSNGRYVEDFWSNLVPLVSPPACCRAMRATHSLQGAVARYDEARASWQVLYTYLIDSRDPVIRDLVWLSHRAIEVHTAVSGHEQSGASIEVYRRIEERIDLDRLAKYNERVWYGDTVRTVTARLVVTMELTRIQLKMELVNPGFDGNKGEFLLTRRPKFVHG